MADTAVAPAPAAPAAKPTAAPVAPAKAPSTREASFNRLDALGGDPGAVEGDRTPSPGAQIKTPAERRAEFDKKRAASLEGKQTRTGEDDQPEPPAKPATKPADKAGTVADSKAGADVQTQAEDDGFPTIEAARTMKSGELGRHYKNVKLELQKTKSELTKLKAKSSEANPEVGKLTETVKQYEERMKAQEETLRYVNFEQSDEYKMQYWEPYSTAFQSGRDLVTELRVREVKDSVTDEVTQQKRMATAEDFDRLVMMDNTADASDLAEQMFGAVQAAEVMRERRKVRELNAAKEQAKDKYKKEGGEIFKKRQEAAQAQQREVEQVYAQEIKKAAEKYPQWFAPVDGDEAGNKALEKGIAFADSAFSGKVVNADGTERALAPKELAERHAVMRNKAAGFDRLALQLKQANQAKTELEAKLKEFQESEPKAGDGAGKGAKGDDAAAPRGAKGIEARMQKWVT